jgi:large subunit ribosomal protein L25
MLEIKVKGKRGKNTVLLKDTQWDSIYDTPKHLDFFRVEGSDIVTVAVPIVTLNVDTSPGIKAGGSIEMIRHELEVECRADAIPDHIEIDCATMELDTTVHIEDIPLPNGIEVPHDANFTIFNLVITKVAEEPEAEEVEDVEGTDAATPEATEGDKEE